MRVSLRLSYIAPPAVPVRAGVLEVHQYLSKPVPDLEVKLNEDVQRLQFLIQTYQTGGRPTDRYVKKAKDECRFASPRKIPSERAQPFPMHQFSFQNPDVLIDFKERSSTDPAREDDADSEPVEPTGETAARELAQKEERRRKREKLVNQEEFVDVYFVDNPTPLRLNITELSTTETIRLLTSVVPPPTTSTTASSSSPADVATSSPSEPSPSIPLGEGPELWEYVRRTRTLENGAFDETTYVWRNGTRQKLKSRDELIAEGIDARGPGLPEAKRMWTEGVVNPRMTIPPKAK